VLRKRRSEKFYREEERGREERTEEGVVNRKRKNPMLSGGGRAARLQFQKEESNPQNTKKLTKRGLSKNSKKSPRLKKSGGVSISERKNCI